MFMSTFNILLIWYENTLFFLLWIMIYRCKWKYWRGFQWTWRKKIIRTVLAKTNQYFFSLNFFPNITFYAWTWKKFKNLSFTRILKKFKEIILKDKIHFWHFETKITAVFLLKNPFFATKFFIFTIEIGIH